jgi:hypothetical protein
VCHVNVASLISKRGNDHKLPGRLAQSRNRQGIAPLYMSRSRVKGSMNIPDA